MTALKRKSFSLFRVLVILSLLPASLGSVFGVQAAPLPSTAAASQAEPHVRAVTPEAGFLDKRNEPVQVTFDVPMDQAQTESALTVQPDAARQYKWVDAQTLQIRFDKPFNPGTQYTLTFAGGDAANAAKSTAGVALAEDFRWYYWLAPFTVSVTTPQPSEVALKFSTLLDTKKTGLPFKIEPQIDGEWKWASDQRAVFTASQAFPPAKQYTITRSGPLYDQFGEIPYRGSDLVFSSPPPVKSVEPTEGMTVAADFGPIRIVFSEPVDLESVQQAFTITPATSGRFSWSQSTGATFKDILSFMPDGLLERGEQYTVSISPNLKARAGTPLMLASYSWTFSIDPYYYSYGAAASFGEAGYNVQVVDVNGPRKVQFGGSEGVISFDLYRYDLIDFAKLYSDYAGGGYGLPSIPLPAAEENRLVATWYYKQGTHGGGNVNETVIPPDVPPGLYVLNLKHEGRSFGQLFLVLTRNTIVAKRSGDGLFVWVSDINGGNVADAEVRLYSDRGEKIRAGKTDEQGLYRVTVPDGYSPLLVSATVVKDKETDVTLTGFDYYWTSYGSWQWRTVDPEKYLVYTYTDRPIYRPGQTVNFKSILRTDQDVKYSLLPAGTATNVNIRDPKGNLLQSTQAELNEFGSVNGSFAIAEGATLGNYSIEVLVNGEGSQQAFKVEDYRKPDFKVTVTPTDPDRASQLIAGEGLDLEVDVRYFFDEPVAGAQLTYKSYELSPNYYYWWDTDSNDVSYNWLETSSQIQKITSTAGADGKAAFSIQTPRDPNAFEYAYRADWRSSLKTKMFAVEVTADDGSNQPVSATYIYKVVNAAEKLSLDTDGYFKTPNQPFTVQAKVSDLFDKAVPERALTLDVKRWNNTGYKTFALTSDANGSAGQELSLETGYYELILSGKDSLGNPISYERWLYLPAHTENWMRHSTSQIDILAERETYKPYETARFMIESEFSGPALLTFERGSVIHTKQVELTAPLTVVEAQIIPEDAPNIFVSINAWEPVKRDEEQGAGEYYYYSNIPDSTLRLARTELLVEADTKSLDVAISTDKTTYAPGEEITVNIDVKDNNARPVKAEVSLALVDEAIFSLSEVLEPNIFAAFYGPRPLSVETYDSMRPWREISVGGRGGGGGESVVPQPRRDFPDTAAWYPALVTDANGRATITFKLPDNLTSWRLSAKAVTLDHRVGQTYANVETKKELLLRPLLPRTLTTGDQAQLTVMVHNYSTRERTVKVSLKGPALQIQNEGTQSINVPAGGAAPVGWRVIPTGTTETRLTFTAASDDGQFSDAIELPLPVQPLAVADVQSASGSFADSLALNLPLPADALADNSQVTLRLSRSPASSLLDGLEYLTGYPYGCVEQTMSRAMPNAVLGRASSELGIGGEEFRTRIDPLVAVSIQKLYGYQHHDGGWGWWFDDQSDDYQTAWVLHGLAVIDSSGYAIEPAVIENAVKYLNGHLDSMDIRTRAYALYSMALAGKPNAEATRLLADSSVRELDPFSQAALALALKRSGEEERAAAVIDLLESAAMHNDKRAYWPQAQQDGEYHHKTMASTIRTTAFALTAILEVDGLSNPLVKPAADYLIGRRTGYGWGTTNETSFTILALTDYLSSQQAGAGTSEYRIELNSSELSTGTLEPGRMFTNIDIPFSKLNSGDNNLKLANTGAGPLYYDLITRYTLSRKTVEQAGTITLTRKYLDPQTKQELEKIAAGQLVRVELTVRLPQTASFMLIEDHLPGGLEALNEGLNTTSHISPYYEEYYDDTVFYWQDYGYNNKEIRGDRVTFFITEMPSGTKTLSYLARATISGTFIALPAESYAMYDPLLWGRSSDAVFVVEPQK